VSDDEVDPTDSLKLWHRFIPPEIILLISIHTKKNKSMQYKAKEEHTQTERAWHDLTGVDVEAFRDCNVDRYSSRASIKEYWNTSEDNPVFPIQQRMTRKRYEQISRYLKVNNPAEDVSREFWDKIKPILSAFRKASQERMTLGDTVSIDKILIAAKTRSGHLMQVGNKAAGKGYKIYSLALRHYLYNWIYTSNKTLLRGQRTMSLSVKPMRMTHLQTSSEQC
jgi:Transposase IS4